MADSINSVDFLGLLRVTETLDVEIDDVTNKQHTLEITSMPSGQLTTSSTIAVSKAVKEGGAWAASTADTFDLTAFARSLLPSVDFSSLKIKLFMFQAPDTNTDKVYIAPGASNKYNFGETAIGDVRYSVTPGGWVIWYNPDYSGVSTVAATRKNLQVNGGAASGTYNFILVFG